MRVLGAASSRAIQLAAAAIVVVFFAACGSDDDAGISAGTDTSAGTSTSTSTSTVIKTLNLDGSWTATIEDLRVVLSTGQMSGSTVTLDGTMVRTSYANATHTGSSSSPATVGPVTIKGNGMSLIGFERKDNGSIVVLRNRATLAVDDAGRSTCATAQAVPDAGVAKLSQDDRVLRFVTGAVMGRGTSCELGMVQVAWTQVLTRAG